MAFAPLDCSFVADLREIAANRNVGHIAGFTPSGLTIGAAVEIACLHVSLPQALRLSVHAWENRSPVMRSAAAVFRSGVYPSREDMWKARGLEFFPIRGPNWANPLHYHPFESRFKIAAREAGFGKKADALCGALFEMADNVAQHSGSDPSGSAPGLIGYHVSEGNVSFAIADSGRGVVASLKENPIWGDVTNSKVALMNILEKRASRRIYGGDGEGFKQVFRSLVDLNGIVELCSGDGRVRLACAPDGSHQAQPQFTGCFPGLQITISCSLAPPAKEVIFPLDYLT